MTIFGKRERDKRSGSKEARGYVDRAGVGCGDAIQGVREHMFVLLLDVYGCVCAHFEDDVAASLN